MAIHRLPKEAVRQIFSDNWPIRRRWLRITVLWLGINSQGVIIYALTHESNVGVQIVMALLGALIALLVAYIFGATWDDNNKRSVIPVEAETEPEKDKE